MINLTAPAVCADRQRRTCLLVAITATTAEFIPLSIENGFNVEKMPAKEFSELYQQLADYPPSRCAALYAQYSMTVGASPEALECLGRLTKLSQKEIDMATAKKSAAKAAKPAAEKPAAKATKAVAKPAKSAAPAEAKPKKAGTSAAQMFKDLIMEGKLTDDKIFEKVQAAHGLDDKKRSYVGWYRKDLIKKGMTPPEAKVGK